MNLSPEELQKKISETKDITLLEAREKTLDQNGKRNEAYEVLKRIRELENEQKSEADQKKAEEQQKDIHTQKKEEAEKKVILLESLMKKLNEEDPQNSDFFEEIKKKLNENYAEGFQMLLDKIAHNTQQIRVLYDSLWTDTTLSLEQKKQEIRAIREKEEILFKELRNIPQFNQVKTELPRMKYTTRKWFKMKKIEGEGKALILPQFAKNPNFRDRVRFNQMINNFNMIEASTDSRDDKNLAAINYFLSKVAWRKGGSLVREIKQTMKDLRYDLS